MSAEVERSQADSGLTATSSGLGVQETQSNREGAPPLGDPEDQGQTAAETQPGDGHTCEAGRSPADKRSKENDKENERGGDADSAETVKRKVVEAPPPKVNAWTKRTTGRVSVPNISPGSQDKGEARWCTARRG